MEYIRILLVAMILSTNSTCALACLQKSTFSSPSTQSIFLLPWKNEDPDMCLFVLVECYSKHVPRFLQCNVKVRRPQTSSKQGQSRHISCLSFTFLETKTAWPHHKIVAAAKRHARAIKWIMPLYIENIKDVDTKLEDKTGLTLTVWGVLNQFEVQKENCQW